MATQSVHNYLIQSVTRGGTIPIGDYMNVRIEATVQIETYSGENALEAISQISNDIDRMLGHSLLDVIIAPDIQGITKEEVTYRLNRAVNKNILRHVANSVYAKRILSLAAAERPDLSEGYDDFVKKSNALPFDASDDDSRKTPFKGTRLNLGKHAEERDDI